MCSHTSATPWSTPTSTCCRSVEGASRSHGRIVKMPNLDFENTQFILCPIYYYYFRFVHRGWILITSSHLCLRGTLNHRLIIIIIIIIIITTQAVYGGLSSIHWPLCLLSLRLSLRFKVVDLLTMASQHQNAVLDSEQERPMLEGALTFLVILTSLRIHLGRLGCIRNKMCLSATADSLFLFLSPPQGWRMTRSSVQRWCPSSAWMIARTAPC